MFLWPAALIFPALFLFHSPVYKIVFPKSFRVASPKFKANTNIVMAIFDEFPLTSLLDENQQVDPDLYPNFAALARCATWYRNATTVSEGTLNSLPAILDGLLPRPNLRLLPEAKDHPRTLFRLLGESYSFHVVENNTRLCPQEFCGSGAKTPFMKRLQGLLSDVTILYSYILLPSDLTAGLPNISHSWKDFARDSKKVVQRTDWRRFEELTDWEDRPQVFKEFINSIQPSSKPTLHFIHTLLPHAPWEYLPSGRKYTLDMAVRGTVGTNDRGMDPHLWKDDRWAVIQGYQRHLLQVGFVDRLLGDLMEHLRKVGLFDSSLIVITADHGTSFRPNESRRRPSPTNYPDIVTIPLFIKLPDQQKGIVDDRNVETIDILPTLADILKIDFPWKTDGRSVVNPSLPEKPEKILITEKNERLVFPRLIEKKYDTVKQKLDLLGGTPDELFKIGAHRELIGHTAGKFAGSEDIRTQYEVDNPSFLSNVDFAAPIVLTHITGRILRSQQNPFRPLNLAIAVNGMIRAVTETYTVGNEERFSAVLSDSAFQPGHNKLDIFLASNSNGMAVLRMIHKSSVLEYRWGDLILFRAKDGNAQSYQAEGWGRAEQNYTWTDGKRARVVLPVSTPDSPVNLQMRLSGFLVPGKVESQRVRVVVNHQLMAEWVIQTPGLQERSLLIPRELLASSGEAIIVFETPQAVSPAILGTGDDLRELGIALAWLRLTPQHESHTHGTTQN